MLKLSRTLSSTGQASIAAAIRDAETITSAEIIVVVDRVAGNWRSWAMVVALLLAMVAPWPLIELTQVSTRGIFAFQIIVAAILIVLFQPQAMRLRLVPRLLRRRKGHDAAQREFVARGMTATRDRTGVLIYVALAEHYAEIVTDTAIVAKIGDDVWRTMIADLIAAIGRDQLAEGLVAVVQASGQALAAQFPPMVDDSDELDNKVIVI
ncbi:MAG: TPM domain-containing protein [Bosea sp. (in: a-proteobacteria)]